MNNYSYLVLLGAFIQIIGAIPYFIDTVKGTTKPNRITYLLWSVAPIIATVAAISGGVRWATVPVLISGLTPLIALLLSFVNKNSYWKLEKFDYWCGFFSVCALVLWYITKNPNIAITFAIISDALAAFPTIIKSWRYPETETASSYVASIICSATAFAAVKNWSFAEISFPIYLIIGNATISTLIISGKARSNKKLESR